MTIVAAPPRKMGFLASIFRRESAEIFTARKDFETVRNDLNKIHLRLFSSQKLLLKILEIVAAFGEKTKLGKFLYEIDSSYKFAVSVNIRVAKVTKEVNGAVMIDNKILGEIRASVLEFKKLKPSQSEQNILRSEELDAVHEITTIDHLYKEISEFNREMNQLIKQLDDAYGLLAALTPTSNVFSPADKKRGKIIANTLHNILCGLKETHSLFHESLAELLKIKALYTEFKRYDEGMIKKNSLSHGALYLTK